MGFSIARKVSEFVKESVRSFAFVSLCGWDEKRSAFESVAFTEDPLLVEMKTIGFVEGIEESLTFSLGIAQVQILLIVIDMFDAPDYND